MGGLFSIVLTTKKNIGGMFPVMGGLFSIVFYQKKQFLFTMFFLPQFIFYFYHIPCFHHFFPVVYLPHYHSSRKKKNMFFRF